MATHRRRKVFTGLTMASSLAWMSILPATAVFAQSAPTVTPGSVTLSGPIQPTNGSATFTASASDPNGTAEYQFWVESPTGQWTDMQNYSPNNTFTLATPSAGDYLVAVEVLDQAQVAAGDWSLAQTTLPDAVFNGSTLSVVSNASGEVAKGQTVTLTATEANVFSPLYQFWYQEPDGTWVQSGNYQSGNTFTFTASQAGTYKYVAYVKSPLAANNPHGALESNVGSQVAYGTASQVVLSLASPSVMANGSATDLLTATVEDRNGNTVANFSGSVTIVETNPQFSGNLVNGAGSARVTITNGVGPVALTPVSGDGNYRYTVTSDNLMSAATAAGGTGGQGQVANVTYGSATVMTTAPSDHGLGLQSTLPNLESNAQSSTTVWVQLQDSTGAPYATANGQYVTLTLGGSASGSFSSATIDTTDTIEVPVGASQFPVTVYSQKGVNGNITVMAQSNDPSVTPLTPATLSIPVVEVGSPTAVDISQVGTVSGYTVYQADVVDRQGDTISVGTGAVGSLSVADTSASGSGTLNYSAVAAGGTGWRLTGSTADSSAPSVLTNAPFTQGMLDFAVATEESENGQPLTITATASNNTATDPFSAVSGSTVWHFAAPTAGYVETLPAYSGQELSSATVTAGARTHVAFQLVDQYGSAVQEAGQPIWFTLQDSGVAALPNGASQSGDTYEAFTNSQGIASIPLSVLSTAAPNSSTDALYVAGSGSLGSVPGQSFLELSPEFHVVSSANFATQIALSDSSSALLNGATITVPAGTPLATVTATLSNALGAVTSGNVFDELQFSSSNSGVVSVGSGDDARGSQIQKWEQYEPYGSSPIPGGVYPFQGRHSDNDGLYAGMAGTATITVTDVSNSNMPSASFTVKVVPGAPILTPWIEYQGQHVSSINQVPLPPNTPVELQVVNVDAGGDPIAVTGSAPLAVQLPALPPGEAWQASPGGVGSASMVVDIPPGQSSANVWLVSSTPALVSGLAYGQDLATEATATGATVVQFTQATASSNGTMTIDLAYSAPLASGTVAAGSAFTVTDSAVPGAALDGAAATVSGTDTVALTVAIPSGSTDAGVDPFDTFTIATASSAVDSMANGSDYTTAPVSVSTSGAVSLPALPTTFVKAAGESQNLNQAGATATESTFSGTLHYAASLSDFAFLSAGSGMVLTPNIVPSGTVTAGGTVSSNQTLAVWFGQYFVDLTNEAPPSSAAGSAYVGFAFTAPAGDAVIWRATSGGQVTSDANTSATDELYIAVATGVTGGTSWTTAPAKTITDWVELNGTFYTFTATQP